MLFFRGYVDSLERQRFISPDNTLLLLRQADTYDVTTEAISRVEFDWTTLTNHTLQANFELAWNVVDGKFNQTDDDGTSIISVAVPGSNSRVEELRGDLLLQDTWSMGQFELDYGLGAELSRISQSGDIKQSRHFSFIKPELSLLYTPAQGNQTRARLAREVAQLNLDDFISATVFEDDDLALGNPDLRPDTSWVAELSHERRFGRDAVIKATLFHHWINDVLDLLPLSAQFEAPGNIGDGRRWGIELESTLPLQWLGLIGARLKLKARWQDSTVTDPITGEPRVLSANNGTNFFSVDNEYAYSVDFRQDSQVLRAAWGLFMQERAKQPLFKVNELEINDEGTELNLFVETTRWLGIKMRIDLENVLDYKELRNRTVYVGERQITAVRRFERLDETGGPRVFFTISGSY